MSNSPEDPLESDKEAYSDAENLNEVENQSPPCKRPESGKSPAYERLLDLSYFLREQFFIWNKRILILMAVTTTLAVVAELEGGYISRVAKFVKDSNEASELVSTLKRIMLVRANLLHYEKDLSALKNKKKAKELIKDDPWEWVDKFEEVTEELKVGIRSAREIKKTKIRFSEKFLMDSLVQLNRVYKDLDKGDKLLSSEIEEIGLLAEMFEPDTVEGVMELHSALRECKRHIRLFRKELIALCDKDIKGNSSNMAIDEYIRNKDDPVIMEFLKRLEKRKSKNKNKSFRRR